MNYKDNYENLIDDELIKIAYKNCDEYEESANNAAKEILDSRYGKDFWENEKTNFKKLIEKTEFYELEEYINNNIKNERVYLEDYKKIINDISKSNTSDEEEFDIFFNLELYDKYKIVGIDLKGENFDLSYFKIENWVNGKIYIEQLKDIGKIKYIISCLKKINNSNKNQSIYDNNLSHIQNFVDEKCITKKNEMLKEKTDFERIREMCRVNIDMNSKQLHGHVWKRFFARSMDSFMFGSLMYYLLYFIYDFPTIKYNFMQYDNICLFIVPIVINFIYEVIAIYFTGTTIGKWLFGIKLKNSKSNSLSFNSVLRRSFLVLIFGEAFKIGYLSIGTYLIAYRRYITSKTTYWDEHCKIIVEYNKIGKIKIIISMMFLAVYTIFLYCFKIY